MPSPLDLLELQFMRTALCELLLLSVAGGLLGAWIVLRRLAFFTHAVGTAAFPGVVLAAAAGVAPQLGGAAVALAFAGGVERTERHRGTPADAATGLALAAALAIGVVLSSDVFESGASVDRLLFGSLLGLTGTDIALAGAAAAAAVVASLCCGRSWTAAAFDRQGSVTPFGSAGGGGGSRARARPCRRGVPPPLAPG